MIMTSHLGTVLPRTPVAWFWFALALILAAYFSWSALVSGGSWLWPGVFTAIAALIFVEPRLRKPETETIQVNDTGVLRVHGSICEQISWGDVHQIRIITTDGGPFQEDVYFALGDANGKGCLVPHDAAVRTKLLEELQTRFPGLDNDMVIKAMGCTSNNQFIIWSRGSR